LQLDESEIANVEKIILVEAQFMSAFATLLQKEIGDVNEAENQIPAFVFGPTLLFEFGDSDENALKEFFANFFPERVLFLVLNTTMSWWNSNGSTRLLRCMIQLDLSRKEMEV
jgi:hypothetical protein